MSKPSSDRARLLRELPKVDQVLARPGVAALATPRWAVVEAVRRAVEARRKDILQGVSDETDVLDADIAEAARELARPSLRPVVNATGVVIHTNLGRAPLAEEAVARVAEIARGYSNLEYEVGKRSRGSRHDHVSEILCALCGAEAAVVVNNNASAVLLGLAALARGKEVVVSRGELVEIGGSFRIPDVMAWSGATLREVGTTNKTHARDYRAAIGPDTGLLLKVHKSNFAVVGFVAEVSYGEIVDIGREHGVPVMIDLGSGTFEEPQSLDVSLPDEPTVKQAVGSGADLVTFSGDKLLGGPQGGILAGKADAILKVKKHPLMRAMRTDKMTLAALEATLEIYREGRARDAIPVVRMLSASPDELAARAKALLARVGALPGTRVRLEGVRSAVGGGAMPLATPESWALALAAEDGRSPEDLDAALRAHDPPVIGRVENDRLLLDVRTLADADLEVVAAAVRTLG